MFQNLSETKNKQFWNPLIMPFQLGKHFYELFYIQNNNEKI